jgi:ATP-dependent RNA helicase SUPV3L1/SUV3
VERLAAHAHQVRGSGGDDPVDRDLVTSLGLDEEAIGRLMKEVGFETRDGAWKWRGRRPDRRPATSPTAGHAFAELAKLKR